MAASVQKEEKKVLTEPTTLVGAVREHNKLNDGKVTATQQRLKNRGTEVLGHELCHHGEHRGDHHRGK